MKLTKNQKHFLKTIKDKNVRKYQKQQFKLQNAYLANQPMVFKEGILKTDNPFHIEFLSKHPFNGTLFKEESDANRKILCAIKGNEIITREKPKGIELNKEFLQETLDKSDDLKFCQDLKNICVKFQDYEYASKFRQKERDILDTLSKEKLYELVRNGTITISDFINCEKRKSDKLVESKTVKISEFPFKTFDFSSANLSDLQIEKVIEWMNTWEQLKDTAIPIRFKEDFTIKK